jgi:hypothetical protein
MTRREHASKLEHAKMAAARHKRIVMGQGKLGVMLLKQTGQT